MNYAAAIAAAASKAPQVPVSAEVAPNRVLLIDGDGLAYYCSGNEDTDPGEAKARMIDKIMAAKRASGASRVLILLTAETSHKGWRYAIARAKPYQGKRGDHKPKNWAYLRRMLEGNQLEGVVEQTDRSEADDLFALYADTLEDVVIMSQDKDIRMVPGWHLEWVTHLKTEVTTWKHVARDLVYGRAWFWFQMLRGDPVDNIPGLPYYMDENGKQKQVGEVTATKLLADATDDATAFAIVKDLYQGYYTTRWASEMLEQACLLWLRRTPNADLFDVAAEGNPLAILADTKEYDDIYRAAMRELIGRVNAVPSCAEAEGDGDSGSEGEPVEVPEPMLCTVQLEVFMGSGGAGSLPPDGVHPSGAAPVVQCAVGQDRELLDQLRAAEPVSVLAWQRALLAILQRAAD